MTGENEGKKYRKFYSTMLGRKVLEQETRFVDEKLTGCNKVLSIGCGPAILETRLHQLHPEMTIIGLDNSKAMIKQAPKEISIVYGDAQHLEFEDFSFDAVFYLTSLEFIQNFQKAIEETYRVLKSKGLLLVLMLNPKSRYFQEEYNDINSYIRKNIKHRNIEEIKECISHYFFIEDEKFFLGIRGQKIIDSDDPIIASLFVLEGRKL
jgi:ubiquinone/menaquinone biosynthesis C-methylase UbiE